MYNLFDDLFNDFFNLNNLDPHNFNWNNLFNKELYWLKYFSNSLLNDRNFLNNLENPSLSNYVIDWLLNFNVFSVNNNFLHNLLYLNDFGHFFLERNNNLSFGRYLDDFLFNSWHLDELFNDVINYFNNFDWLVNDLLDFDVSWHLNNFFNVFFNWNDLRYFDDLLYYLLDNPFNFNDSFLNSEDFKDIINADDIKNFLVDHSDNSLVNLQSYSILSLHFLELLKKSFNQNSKMELNLFSSRRAVSVNVFNSNSFRNILNDFN